MMFSADIKGPDDFKILRLVPGHLRSFHKSC